MTDKIRLYTASDVFNWIAEVANNLAHSANEPATEIAGMFVSFMYARPELAQRFMDEGAELLHDGTLTIHRDLSLSYRAINGKIIHPNKLRKLTGNEQ